jgi:hypothetical protein
VSWIRLFPAVELRNWNIYSQETYMQTQTLFPRLYKKTSSGALQTWSIGVYCEEKGCELPYWLDRDLLG